MSKINKELRDALAAQEPLGADADRSEQPANVFSNLNSDDGTGYDQQNDNTPELDKKRIHDK